MISFIADVHLGNHRQHGGPVVCGLNDRCNEALTVLDDACVFQDPLVILGDLLDSTRPEPQLLTEIARAFWKRGAQCSVYMLVGNHELVSSAVGDHSLGPLGTLSSPSYVVDTPQVVRFPDCSVAMLPYSTDPAPEYIVAQLDPLLRNVSVEMPRALCMHFGVMDLNTPGYLRSATDAIELSLLAKLCKRYGVTKVFAGHWHQPRTWLKVDGFLDVYQVGALVPPGWREEGFSGYGRIITWDPLSGAVDEECLPGPRFASCTTMLELEQIAAKHPRDIVRVRWTVPPESVEQCRQYAAEVMAEHKNVRAVEVVPEAAQAAVQQARKTTIESVDDDLSAYVHGMRLPANVDAVAVLARSRRYLSA